MKQALLIVAFLVGVAVVAEKPKPYAPPGRAKKAKPIETPPLPVPVSTMKRQSVRALAVPSASFPDVLAPQYGFSKKIAVDFEGGKKGTAIEISWPNWPATNAYSIRVSTNLATWRTFVISAPNGAPKVIVYDFEQAEFYRIDPTPQ